MVSLYNGQRGNHPKLFNEVHVKIDLRFVAEDDESVIPPAEAVLDPDADGEVAVADLVDVQQSHGELDLQGCPATRTPEKRKRKYFEK